MERILSICAGCLAALLTLSCAGASDDFQIKLLAEHNRQRAQRGLEPLALDPGMSDYAQRHAERMVERGHLYHSSMSRLASESGGSAVSENIAWGQESETEVCDSWIKSPGHKANILGKKYKRVGFGVKKDERGRKYWCAVFAA